MPAEIELASGPESGAGASARATSHILIAYTAASDADARHLALPVLLRHLCAHGTQISHGTREFVRCLELEHGAAGTSMSPIHPGVSVTTLATHDRAPAFLASVAFDTTLCTRSALGAVRVAMRLGDSHYCS